MLLDTVGDALIAVAIFVAILFLRPFRSRREREREARAASAVALGMRYQAPGALIDAHRTVDEGSHRFQGSTAGLDWEVETLLLADDAAPGPTQGESIQQTGQAEPLPSVPRSYSRWTCRSRIDAGGLLGVANGLGRGYLLIMALPAATLRPSVRPGVLDPLLDKMATLSLFLAVRAFFGEPRAGGISIGAGDRVVLGDEALDPCYTVFCNQPERLSHFGDAARDWLVDHQALQSALLWDGRGLAVSVPGARLEPAAVAELAAAGMALATALGLVPATAVAANDAALPA